MPSEYRGDEPEGKGSGVWVRAGRYAQLWRDSMAGNKTFSFLSDEDPGNGRILPLTLAARSGG